MEPTLPRTSAQLSQSLEQLEELIDELASEPYELSLAQAPRSGNLFEFRQSLPSKVQAISPFTTQLMRCLAKFRKIDGGEMEIEMGLREALANAVVHGNCEDPKKRVYVICRCSIDGEISITVRDQGQGFDTRAVPDPTTADNLYAENGRGIYLMRAFMDEVTFEESGAVVHMRKGPSISSAAQRQEL